MAFGNPGLDPTHPLTANLHAQANPQLSAYDERPDPKKPGQQGVLFRHEAPARGTPDQRRGIVTNRWGDEEDTRLGKGRATGMVPEGGILYHGTSSRLRPGSMIVPGHQPNFEAYRGGIGDYGVTRDVNREHAFATPNLHDAYRYAKVSQDVQQQKRGSSRRAFVYEVQPTGPVQIDAEDSAREDNYGQAEAFQTKHAYRVLRALPIAHAQEAYRNYMEDEMGESPGSYPFAPKTRGWDW